MCNLYRMTAPVAEIARLFGPLANDRVNLPPLDGIYPGAAVPVVRRDAAGARSIDTMAWGVPPPGDIRRPVTNVRNLASPFWRAMLNDPARRCLVPATQFCEWTGDKGAKRKIWFARADDAPFAFAGLWRPTPDGPRMAFLTCAPNDMVGAFHPKAMPVMLDPDTATAWLAVDTATACALARPFPDAAMRIVEADPPRESAPLLL